MKYDVIIVGGGASGLMAGIIAGRLGRSVLIIEHMDRVGKKILSTGNGKCNLTNLVQDYGKYRGDNPDFALDIVNQFNVDRTLKFFNEIGIYFKNKSGYIYPNSGQASSVLDVLRYEVGRLGVEVICNVKVLSIHKEANNFKVKVKNEDKDKDKEYISKKLILATGGMAAPKTGSDGSGFELAKSLGHNIVDVVPALVGLKANTRNISFKTMAGVRCDALVTVFINNEECCSDRGELQITDYGLSGIPIFQISRYASKALYEKKKVYIIVDYFPDLNKDDIFRLLKKGLAKWKTFEESLTGILNKKLVSVLIKTASISRDTLSTDITDTELKRFISYIKEFKVDIIDTNSFSEAQICAGGVNTKELNNTLESKKVKDLYFAGEIIDIDGVCGGYNLQWAWSSGYVAGYNAVCD